MSSRSVGGDLRLGRRPSCRRSRSAPPGWNWSWSSQEPTTSVPAGALRDRVARAAAAHVDPRLVATARPPSIDSGASNCEPTSRRPTVRETPPTSWRNTTQANEPSSSMSMSGESALPPPATSSVLRERGQVQAGDPARPHVRGAVAAHARPRWRPRSPRPRPRPAAAARRCRPRAPDRRPAAARRASRSCPAGARRARRRPAPRSRRRRR